MRDHCSSLGIVFAIYIKKYLNSPSPEFSVFGPIFSYFRILIQYPYSNTENRTGWQVCNGFESKNSTLSERIAIIITEGVNSEGMFSFSSIHLKL